MSRPGTGATRGRRASDAAATILEAVQAGRLPDAQAVSLLMSLDRGARRRPHAERCAPQGHRPAPVDSGSTQGDGVFALSRGQEALWVLHQSAPASAAYNLPLALRLRDDVDPDRLERALQALIRRHGVLRTNVRLTGGRPTGVDNGQAARLVRLDLRHLLAHELHTRLAALVRLPFDLEREPLHRAYHVATLEPGPLLVLVFHHLVTDGVSSHVLVQELVADYARLERGAVLPVTTSRGYDAFVRWQRGLLASEAGARQRAYWLRKLASSSSTVLEELVDRPLAPALDARGDSVSFMLDPTTWASVQQLARRERVSTFAVVFAAFVGLLHLHARQPTIQVAVPVEGRARKEFEHTVGLFVNTVVLSCNCQPHTSWRALIAQAYEELLESEAHADYPYISVVDALREAGHTPARHELAFYYQGAATLRGTQAGCVLGVLGELRQEGEFALAVEVVPAGAAASVHFKYRPALFERAHVERLAEHYREALGSVLDDPERRLTSTSLFSRAERALLNEVNATDVAVEPRGTLVDLVLTQATRSPHATAVVDRAGTHSYAQVGARIEALAAFLHGRGLRPGALVGVLLERGVDLVVAMLAVHHAGAAYVPLDPALPEARLRLIVEDAGLSLVLTERALADPLASLALELLSLDGLGLAPGQGQPSGPPAIWPMPERLAGRGESTEGSRAPDTSSERGADWRHELPAYVLYTSGSTGRPKGVEISQRNLVNFLHSMARRPGCTAADRLLAVTTVSFDIAALELFLPLLCGASVEIVPSDVCRDGLRLKERLEASPATLMQATPATWQMLLAAGWAGRPGLRLLCGGEALPRELADRLRVRADQVWNMYGPTETTVWSSLGQVRSGPSVDVGRPIDNTRFLIVDEAGDELPFGARGELCIAGLGVARGYWRRPELTAQKFVPEPGRRGGARMFRTGDLARFLPDGSLEHLGRLDGQVKIRGFRVELAEIEATLRRHERVEQVKVLLREQPDGHKALCAFVVATPAPERDLGPVLQEHLRRWLPEYMVPARWVWLRSFPLTPNRKTDTRPLATWPLDQIEAQFGERLHVGPQARVASVEHTPPADSDALLARLMADLRATVAELADLPANAIALGAALGEYGFDSVRFTSLSLRLGQRFDTRVEATVFYDHPSISALAAHLLAAAPDRIRSTYGIAAPVAVAAPVAPAPATPRLSPAVSHVPGPVATTFDPVAIIGLGGRLPGAATLDEFWSCLEDGRDLVGAYPSERPVSGGLFERTCRGRDARLFQGAFLHDVDCFDAPLFRISPREAAQMDPQQRLLLQAAREAMEDAGYAPAVLSGSATGVFVGLSASDYFSLLKYDMTAMDDHFLIGNAHSVAANRISYLFDLQGPSATIDTACSSSLVAIHRAVRALQTGACELALAGGANLILAPYAYLGLERAGMLSADGRCRTFDARADGYGRGEGVVLLLLKRLDRALADGDPVHAVVIGSAENHGGRTHSLTVPNPRAQAEVVIAAHVAARIPPRSVGYVEAHGTGTQLGDPIEVSGLKQAFAHLAALWGEAPGAPPHVGLGSVKTNIGHLEAAAGVAGVLKLVLALRHRRLPGLVHLTRPNRLLELEGSPLRLQVRTEPWEPGRAADGSSFPRRAGISSFGMGGSNVHLVLEEPPAC